MDADQARIRELCAQKDAVILAHYYVDAEVQACADYTGDSFYLSRIGRKLPAHMIVMCGVSFMGETVKLLSPEKKVILPEPDADCPMAHMAGVQEIADMRERTDDLAVVCYVNSTAALKAACDVCVTSSNAVKVVRALKEKNIYFIPDGNLARAVAAALPEKNIIPGHGCCPVHDFLTPEDVMAARAAHPGAPVLVHPECRPEVTALADYSGSTSGMIDHAAGCPEKTIIIGTELGIMYELRTKCPGKTFIPIRGDQLCAGMKKITPGSVIRALETEQTEVRLPESVIQRAAAPLERMLALCE